MCDVNQQLYEIVGDFMLPLPTQRAEQRVAHLGRGYDSFAQPGDQGGLVLGAEQAEAAVLANLGALMPLCALTPLPLGVRFRWHADLSGEVGDDAAANVLAAIREASIELESFEQDGETEPGGARLVAEKFALVRGEGPVLGEFFRAPVLLHARRSSTLRSLGEFRLKLRLPLHGFLLPRIRAPLRDRVKAN